MDWFSETGAYVLVDGQFGSTGKGLLAAVLAHYGQGRITHVTTNAGPNSGHTAYWSAEIPYHAVAKGFQIEQQKIMTQQIPVASVFLNKLGTPAHTLLNAGAIIDPKILADEAELYGMLGKYDIHPNAAVITPDSRAADVKTVHNIASTGKGVGPAIQAKIGRTPGYIAADHYHPLMLPQWATREGRTWDNLWRWDRDVVFVETAQGFSLGLNSSFYPNVTSRECTVMQALADARIPAQALRNVAACYRTYPIRVGNTENSSGGFYPDQEETTWEAIGVEPELTSVTKRVRRVFTWSDIQFRDSIAANAPDTLFFNFMNYLPEAEHRPFLKRAIASYIEIMGRPPLHVFVGLGPYITDVKKLQPSGVVRA